MRHDFPINVTFQRLQTWTPSAARTSHSYHSSFLVLSHLVACQMVHPSLHHRLEEGKLQKEQDLPSTSVLTTVPATALSRCNTELTSCVDFFSHRFEADHRTSDSPVLGSRSGSGLRPLASISSEHNVQWILLFLCFKEQNIRPWDALARCCPTEFKAGVKNRFFGWLFFDILFDTNTCSDDFNEVGMIPSNKILIPGHNMDAYRPTTVKM